MVGAGLEHFEGFAKGEITHDVEGVVVEPGGGVDWFSGEEGELRHEIVGVGCYAAFVISKRCGIGMLVDFYFTGVCGDGHLSR